MTPPPEKPDGAIELLRGIRKELTESNRKLFYLGILLGAHVGVTTLLDVSNKLPTAASMVGGMILGIGSSVTLVMMGRTKGA